MPRFPHIFSMVVYVNKKIMIWRKRSRKINGEQREWAGRRIAFLPPSDVLQGSEIRTQGTLLSCSTPDLQFRRKREGKSTSYGIIVTRSFAKSVKRTLESGWTYTTGFPVCLFVLAVIVLESPAYGDVVSRKRRKCVPLTAFLCRGLISITPLLHRITVHI